MNKGKQDQINGKQDRVRPLVYRPTVCSTAGLTQKKSLQEFLLFLAFTLQECFRTLECDATGRLSPGWWHPRREERTAVTQLSN